MDSDHRKGWCNLKRSGRYLRRFIWRLYVVFSDRIFFFSVFFLSQALFGLKDTLFLDPAVWPHLKIVLRVVFFCFGLRIFDAFVICRCMCRAIGGEEEAVRRCARDIWHDSVLMQLAPIGRQIGFYREMKAFLETRIFFRPSQLWLFLLFRPLY